MNGPVPAVFLDRDGVIIANREQYVRTWEDVEILPGALSALARLAARPEPVILVTNQSAVGRGLISQEAAEAINGRLLEVIAQAGGRIDDVFMCPHAPEDGCSCRKPLPGLILAAAAAHGIDLGRSVLIGDALTDLQAGRAAGIGRVLLVRSGRGIEQERRAAEAGWGEFDVFEDLAAAVNSLHAQ